MEYILALGVIGLLCFMFFPKNKEKDVQYYQKQGKFPFDTPYLHTRAELETTPQIEKDIGIPIDSRLSQQTSCNTDKDSWEGWFYDIERPVPVKATLHIDYRDGAGQKSKRTVDVRQFGAFQNSNMLIGHCRMRNATRTFKTDRIIQCVDEQTGEVIEDVAKYLMDKYENSPERSCELLYENEYDFIRALLYVGKADGQLRAAEKGIICEACRSLVNDERITEKMVADLLLSIGVPTIHAFKMAVGRIGKNKEKLETLLEISTAIIDTQKTVHPSEREAIDYIMKVVEKRKRYV